MLFIDKIDLGPKKLDFLDLAHDIGYHVIGFLVYDFGNLVGHGFDIKVLIILHLTFESHHLLL